MLDQIGSFSFLSSQVKSGQKECLMAAAIRVLFIDEETTRSHRKCHPFFLKRVFRPASKLSLFPRGM